MYCVNVGLYKDMTFDCYTPLRVFVVDFYAPYFFYFSEEIFFDKTELTYRTKVDLLHEKTARKEAVIKMYCPAYRIIWIYDRISHQTVLGVNVILFSVSIIKFIQFLAQRCIYIPYIGKLNRS